MLKLNKIFQKKQMPALIASAILYSTSPAVLSEEKSFEINIKDQALGSTLIELGKQAGVEIIVSQGVDVKGKLPEINGSYTLEEALKYLFQNLNLSYQFTSDDTVVIKEAEPVGTGQEDAKEVEEVVVTGSRIAKVSSQMAANVISMDAESLRATGESTLEGALRQLPQNVYGSTEVGAVVPVSGMSFNGALNITGGSSINLRGLGGESTLVLIDGRRIGKSGVYGGVSDITGIPLSAVERVDIMLDGASSIYGSDAVGGVINIILKKDYEGAEITYQYGEPEAGGFSEHVLTMSGGTVWDSGRVNATFEHFRRNNLDGSERPERLGRSYYTTRAYVTIPWSDGPAFYRYNGQNYLPSQLADLGLTGSSPGVEEVRRTRLPANQDGTALSVADFTEFYNELPIDENFNYGVSLIPRQIRNTIQVGFDQELPWLGRNTILTGNVYYSERNTDAAEGAFVFQGVVPATDSSNPFESDLSAYWRIPSVGDKRYETDQQVSRWNLALDGAFGENWDWSLAAGQSRDRIDSTYYGDSIDRFSPKYQELLSSGLNFLAGDITAANSPELLSALVDKPRAVRSINRENTFEVSVDGPLGHFFGGDIHVAAGVDWRQEILDSMSEKYLTQHSLNYNLSLPSGEYSQITSRIQRSAFAELLLPVVGNDNAVAGVKQLNVTGSTRYDSYQGYGSDSTWSLGVVWSPIDQLVVKANKATSYVVPTPRDSLVDPVVDYFPDLYPDYFPDWFLVNLVDGNGNETGEFDVMSTTKTGGNPDLMPETASSVTAGIEFTPDLFPGMTFIATWHKTEYSNRIGNTAYPEFISGTDYVGLYPNLTRDEDGWLVIDYRAVNHAVVEVEGVDYQFHYNRDTALGQFTFKANIAYTGKYDRTKLAGEKPVNEVASVGFGSLNVIPEYRYSANLGWYYNGLAINFDANTTSKTISESDEYRRISKSALYTDLLISYDFGQGDLLGSSDWMKNTTLSFKVLNLLNDNPEYTRIDLETGLPAVDPEFSSSIADPRGRMFYVGVNKRF